MLNENSKEISLNEILKQNEYIEKVREINEKDGKEKKFYSLAMGCQMNAHDSENKRKRRQRKEILFTCHGLPDERP